MTDHASTNGQILFVLQRKAAPTSAHEIYMAGAFEYEQQCYNGLAVLSKKGVLHREKQDGVYHYVIAPDADLADWQDELKELDEEGLPAPDPGRRIPLSRTEYTTLSKEEKRDLKHTRSVAVRETLITETVEPAAAPVLETPQFTEVQPTALAVAAPNMLTVAKAVKPYEGLLAQAVERRDAANREIAMIQMMGDITSDDGGWLAFALQDYADLLKLSYESMGDDGDPLIENERRAKEYLANLKNADKSVFRRAAKQLLQWAFICEDSSAGCTDASSDEARNDAEECRRLAALFGVPSQPGDMPD